MPTQDEIERAIAEIVPGGKYPASKLNPLLSDLLSFSSELDVYDGMTADGTSLLDTKLTLIYGVNEITTSTETNYACKLPKPVTGRRLTVVNRSTTILKVFPSNPGGVIHNNVIDAPAIVPPDGQPYIFTCIENPLPGAWVWTAPAIGQWDSGDISATTTSNAFNVNIATSGPTWAAEQSGTYSDSALAYNGLNQPLIRPSGAPAALPNANWYVGFRPSVAWNAVLKIKVYTNIIYDPIAGDPPAAAIFENSCTNWYAVGTTTPNLNGSALYPGGAGNFGSNNFVGLTNTIAGGPGTPGLAANIGDPGTSWGEITGLWSSWGVSYVGDVLISTDGIKDIWFTRVLAFYLKPQIIGNVKFRFFIEYI